MTELDTILANCAPETRDFIHHAANTASQRREQLLRVLAGDNVAVRNAYATVSLDALETLVKAHGVSHMVNNVAEPLDADNLLPVPPPFDYQAHVRDRRK